MIGLSVGGKLGMAITDAIANGMQEFQGVAADLAGFLQSSHADFRGNRRSFAGFILLTLAHRDTAAPGALAFGQVAPRAPRFKPARASPHHIFSISGYG